MSDLALGHAFGEGLKSFPRTIAIYACVALVGAIGLTGLEIATKIPELSIFPKISTPTPDEYEPVGIYNPDTDVPALVAAIERPRDWLAIYSDFMEFQSRAVRPWPAPASSADLSASSAFLLRAASMPNRAFQSLFEWSALAWKSNPTSSQSIMAVGPDAITPNAGKPGLIAHGEVLSTPGEVLSVANASCASPADDFYRQAMSDTHRNAPLRHCPDLAPTAATAKVRFWEVLIGGVLMGMSAVAR
jgi:hypothetical protein